MNRGGRFLGLFRAVTVLFLAWFIMFTVIIFSSKGLSAATELTQGTVKIGYIGDSITVGTDKYPSAVETEIAILGDKYEAVNKGVSGMSTNQWLPGGNNFDTALADFQRKDVTVVSVMLGTNDARNDQMTSSAQYLSNMHKIIDTLLVTGTIKAVILNDPPYVNLGKLDLWSPESHIKIDSYIKDIDLLVNNDNILRGDTESTTFFKAHPDQQVDGVHPNAEGYAHLGALWAASYTELLNSDKDNIVSPQLAPLYLRR